MKPTIGPFLPRPNIRNLRFNDIVFELKLYRLEVFVIKKTLFCIKNHRYSEFDCTVGDRKCQTRASMIVDAIGSIKRSFSELSLAEKEKSNGILLKKIDETIAWVEGLPEQERSLLVKKFKSKSSQDVPYEYGLTADTNKNINTLSLCLVSKLDVFGIKKIIEADLSPNKHTRLINFGAKSKLCQMSIAHERSLSEKHGLNEVSAALEQVVQKGFCAMTSFYPSFIPIVEEFKSNGVCVVKKTTHFCDCGGVTKETNEIYKYGHKKWLPISQEAIGFGEVVVVIYGFKFNGSFSRLKEILGLHPEEISVPLSHQKQCTCSGGKLQDNTSPLSFDFESSVLSCFANHPQFTTEEEIDFFGLNLQNSALHADYNRHKQLSGCSPACMNIFSINHIYAASLAEAINAPSPSVLSPALPVPH